MQDVRTPSHADCGEPPPLEQVRARRNTNLVDRDARSAELGDRRILLGVGLHDGGYARLDARLLLRSRQGADDTLEASYQCRGENVKHLQSARALGEGNMWSGGQGHRGRRHQMSEMKIESR